MGLDNFSMWIKTNIRELLIEGQGKVEGSMFIVKAPFLMAIGRMTKKFKDN